MSQVQVFFSAAEPDPGELNASTVVVVDVLRATSTIVAALAAGARGIYPTSSSEDAVRLATSLGRDDTLLCGERKGLMVEGFHLGNSPAEFTRERVEGKRLVMATTNGTRAFHTASGAERVLVGSFLNLGAVARAVAATPDLVLLCAGREDRFAIEDALCAGLILAAVERERGARLPDLDDAGRAARLLAEQVTLDAAFLADVEGGRSLSAIGLENDVAYCAQLDLHDVVPEMHDRVIRLDDGS